MNVIMIDLHKLSAVNAKEVRDWLTRLGVIVDPSPPVESEEQRRLRVMREFFEATGREPVMLGDMVSFFMEYPDGSRSTMRSVADSWLSSKHALRLAAAEAAERSLFFRQFAWHATPKTCVYLSAEGTQLGGSPVAEAPGTTPESAIVAVTRAILAPKKDLPR